MECYAPLLIGGSNFYFFTDQYCACISLNARFALPTQEGGKERAFRPIRVQYMLPPCYFSYKVLYKVLPHNKTNTSSHSILKRSVKKEKLLPPYRSGIFFSREIWYYSFSRELFSLGKFFGSKDFFKNCGRYCIRGPN